MTEAENYLLRLWFHLIWPIWPKIRQVRLGMPVWAENGMIGKITHIYGNQRVRAEFGDRRFGLTVSFTMDLDQLRERPEK